MTNLLSKVRLVILVAATLAVAPQLARACGCITPDVLESGLSCDNPNSKPHCFAQYVTRGCNPNSPNDYHCMAFTNSCCNFINCPDAKETTPCRLCGGHPCIKAKVNKSGRRPTLADNTLDVGTKSRDGNR